LENIMLKNALALAAATTMVLPATAVTAEARAQRYYTTENGIQYWRGEDGRYYCKRKNGTTGLLIGGAAGALVGRAIDTQGSRATGTIVGAAAGALIGREIDRNRSRSRCR
jgi:uncharacterized protein YcfJ